MKTRRRPVPKPSIVECSFCRDRIAFKMARVSSDGRYEHRDQGECLNRVFRVRPFAVQHATAAEPNVWLITERSLFKTLPEALLAFQKGLRTSPFPVWYRIVELNPTFKVHVAPVQARGK